MMTEWKELWEKAEKLADQWRYPEAIGVAEEALKAAEESLGRNNINVAKILNDLAYFSRHAGRYTEAESFHKRALDVSAHFGPPHHFEEVILNNLGWLYLEQGRHAEAERVFRRALITAEETSAKSGQRVVVALVVMAHFYRRTKRPGEAGKLEARIRRIRLSRKRSKGGRLSVEVSPIQTQKGEGKR